MDRIENIKKAKANNRNVKAREQLKKDGISQEQLEYERKNTKRILKVDIGCLTAEKKYKQDQLDSGEILEKNESRLFNTSSYPKDEVKPKFILENEIKVINRLLEDKQEQLENITKMENAT